MKILVLLMLTSILLSGEYVIKFKEFNNSNIENYKKLYSLEKHFSTSDETLLMLKERGEKYSGEQLADLRTYYYGDLSTADLKTLQKDSNIELIYEKPIIQELPTTTSNYEAKQGYLLANSTNGGTDAKYAWSFQGGKGEGITVVDIEYDWILDHEDLQLQNAILYDSNGKNLTGTPIIAEANPNMADSNYHGTAVLGEIAGKNNGFGVTGLAYESEIKVVSSYTREYGFSVADAIIRAIPILKKGSVILLEAQTTRTEDNGTGKYIPVEYYQAEFDAIKTATSNGMIVVEAGGNGDQNLDDQSLFGTKFQRSVRDSGAIIVGAGAPPSGNYGVARSKLYFSSYGTRVDVQAWGFEIYSTGYGDLFYPSSDPKRSYTKVFGGTSGASPIITSISAQIQGRYQQIHGSPLKPSDMRAILSNTEYSYPQTGDLTKHIGPFPNIKLIFQKYFGDTESCMNISCESWETCSNGVCVLPAGRCETDSQCASNQVCSSDHYCRTSSSGTGGVSTGTVTNSCSMSTSQSAITPFLLMLSILALFTIFTKRKISK